MTSKRGPRSGDDTYDLIDQALYQLAERRKAWLSDPIAAITLIASLIDQAERFLPEQAELRYDPDSPVADARWPYDY